MIQTISIKFRNLLWINLIWILNKYKNYRKLYFYFVHKLNQQFEFKKKGRLLNEKEISIWQAQTNNSLISENDSYILGSSCQLIEQIVTNVVENGFIYVNRNLDVLKSVNAKSLNYETIIAQMAIEKHLLKRVLVLNWDKEPNLEVQDKFYNDSK